MATEDAVTPRSSETPIDETLLPDAYDRLVSVEKLVHGEHNPRRVQPTATLRRSITRRGLNQALIVRPDPDTDVYHITDGWQRYQAATDCGWEELPVVVYDSALAALEATEVDSIVREWTTYQWAQYYQSLAAEVDAASRQQLVETVATMTDGARSPVTVRKYLDALSLPEEVHLLLSDERAGSEQEWAALKNHNPAVRQYGGLWWDVAAQLAREMSSLDRSRVVGIAANAVAFETQADASEFVSDAAARPETPLETIRKEVLYGQEHDRYLEVPRVAVKMNREQKQAIMKHCRENRRSLTDIVTERIISLAGDAEHN